MDAGAILTFDRSGLGGLSDQCHGHCV